jgi:hypothetical protein
VWGSGWVSRRLIPAFPLSTFVCSRQKKDLKDRGVETKSERSLYADHRIAQEYL